MKLYKKMMLLLLLVSLLVLLAACGGNGGTETASTDNNGEQTNGSPGSQEASMTLKLGHMSSTEHAQHLVMEAFAEELQEATEGRIGIEIYPGAALAAPVESYDAAVTGIADIMWGLQGYTAGKFPLTAAIGLPFVEGDTAAEVSKTLWDLYEAVPELQEEYNDVKVLWLHASDPYQIVTRGKQVKKLEDLKGLKLRATSAEADALIKAWGGTPVSLPMPEFYDAVQKGVIDGGIIPVAAIRDLNLGDVVDYVTIGNFHNAAFFTVMNKDVWNTLSPEDQEILESLIGERMAVKAGEAFDNSLQLAYEIMEEEGIEVYELPDDELERFKEAAASVAEDWIAEKESQGLPGQKVYDELMRIAAENNK